MTARKFKSYSDAVHRRELFHNDWQEFIVGLGKMGLWFVDMFLKLFYIGDKRIPEGRQPAERRKG